MPEPEIPFTPNWQRIVADPIWDSELKPYLEGMLDGMMRQMIDMSDAESFKFYQGKCAALRDVLAEPEKQCNIERARISGMGTAGYTPEEIHAHGRGRSGLQPDGAGRRGTAGRRSGSRG